MELTSREIVSELDKFIIGQDEAKKAVAIALRNRYRRSKLSAELRDEITPKNIIMKGPTGVGKTEIARRLSKLVKAPFVKVEATKFTEVGYVGRDVESMIRDLVEASLLMVKKEKYKDVKEKSEKVAFDKIADILKAKNTLDKNGVELTKEQLLDGVKNGDFNEEIIEIDMAQQPKQMNIMAGMGVGMEFNISELVDGVIGGGKKKKAKKTVKEAIEILIQEESDKLIDMDAVQSEALFRAEQSGIIFIDEIDKITGKGGNPNGPDVSREGVQRDILPIVEGCTVSTKYGPIKTDYILFIAAGAFHISKVEDLIPELQGRFPVMVELNSLKQVDFANILKNTENSLLKQYKALLSVDNINIEFTDDAIEEIARIAEYENETSENIGARRLHNVLELLLEDISFNADGNHPMVDVKIDKEYISNHLSKELRAFNLKKYVL
ncbi:MAG: ATP-dependent protease ATPase subunit HslU [Clostridia bacterium]|nr:ATP-dependent protease ATPase subunit HslU [Clostridia bacterium]